MMMIMFKLFPHEISSRCSATPCPTSLPTTSRSPKPGSLAQDIEERNTAGDEQCHILQDLCVQLISIEFNWWWWWGGGAVSYIARPVRSIDFNWIQLMMSIRAHHWGLVTCYQTSKTLNLGSQQHSYCKILKKIAFTLIFTSKIPFKVYHQSITFFRGLVTCYRTHHHGHLGLVTCYQTFHHDHLGLVTCYQTPWVHENVNYAQTK